VKKKMYSDNVIEDSSKYYVLGKPRVKSEGVFQYDGFQVIERATDQVIKQFYTFDEAHKFRKALQEGQAFDGWTPAFILQPSPRIS